MGSEKRGSKLIFAAAILLLIVGAVATTFIKLHKEVYIPQGASVVIEEGYHMPDSVGSFPAEGRYCLACHDGISPARPHASKMMQDIYAMGEELGDPNGCVVCHGGSPHETKDMMKAHSGVPHGSKLTHFTPVPGSLQVNDNTCGLCHGDHTYNAHRSIMNTDAGKIKAITHSWGIDTDTYEHKYGNHAVDDPDGATPRFGTETYKAYMMEMASTFPDQFPTELKAMPQVSLDSLAAMPEQAAFAYLRQCNACHVQGKGSPSRGKFRGMGCAACHSVYSNEGYYEGNDKSINKEEKGHVMVHSMAGGRKSPVYVNGKRITGIQNSTCAACHSAGRRIGHSYQGFMPHGHGSNRGPFNEKGEAQQTNGGYVFKYMRDDVHHTVEKDGEMISGMLCQDCHTTTSMHGNGNIGSTTLATIEIECSDCHGTPTAYPWDLPIGYGDEFGRVLDNDKPRGVVFDLDENAKKFATIYDPKDGYILTARGNAFGNVVREGKDVWVHTAMGAKIRVPLLKVKNDADLWKNPVEAKTAMVAVEKHIESLECYACHSTWAPQYYGYQYVMDFREETLDWVASAAVVNPDGTTADFHGNFVMQPGASTAGDYSHARWENPMLGVNGEGRVSPITGVIQTVATVIGPDGKTILHNKTFKREDGVSAMEMQPLNPHTTSRQARKCEDCHGNKQTMGYGIDGGVYDSDPSVERYADVKDLYGNNVSKHTQVQIQAIKELHHNFMQVLSEEGKQMMTVDSHWQLSSPLTSSQLMKLDRGGSCTACHQDIPNGSIPMKMLAEVAKVANMSFASGDAHAGLLRENNILMAWIKMVGIIGICLLPFVGVALYMQRERLKRILQAIKDNWKNTK